MRIRALTWGVALGVAAGSAAAASRTAVVHQVLDGDTVMIQGAPGKPAEVVRLLGVDAPEDFGKEAPRRAWAAAARNLLLELAGGRMVRLEIQEGTERDRFGRLLAYLHRDDGMDVNGELIRRGLALHYRQYPHARLDAYDRLEAEARAGGAGVFHKAAERRRAAARKAAVPAKPAAARPTEAGAAGSKKKEKIPKFFVTVTGKIHRGTCSAEFVVRDRKAGRIEAYESYQAAQEGKTAKGGRARWRGTSSCKVCRPYSW